MTFADKLQAAWETSRSMLCVGLDPDLDRVPAALRAEPQPLFAFNRAIIEATAPYACAYKPQFAHYAAENRLDELKATLDYLRATHPSKVSILDAKRGDIGNTAVRYAREAFAVYGADAVTVNPYMGGDTIAPFSSDPTRGVFVLCRTSNPGSGELQSLEVEGRPVYEIVAQRAHEAWNGNRNLGLVVGATYPAELARVRAVAPTMPLLVPGIGAQGGDLQAVLREGRDASGYGMLINSSRGILYAGSGETFASAAAEAARELCEAMRAE
ncbi:MAG: orotidine-5'-phosphate decarboxylase [Opitutales bacterium]